MHLLIHTHTHLCVHVCAHTHTHTNTFSHAYAHTQHTHTCMTVSPLSHMHSSSVFPDMLASVSSKLQHMYTPANLNAYTCFCKHSAAYTLRKISVWRYANTFNNTHRCVHAYWVNAHTHTLRYLTNKECTDFAHSKSTHTQSHSLFHTHSLSLFEVHTHTLSLSKHTHSLCQTHTHSLFQKHTHTLFLSNTLSFKHTHSLFQTHTHTLSNAHTLFQTHTHTHFLSNTHSLSFKHTHTQTLHGMYYTQCLLKVNIQQLDNQCHIQGWNCHLTWKIQSTEPAWGPVWNTMASGLSCSSQKQPIVLFYCHLQMFIMT